LPRSPLLALDNAERRPLADNLRLSDVEPDFTCTRYGHRGGEIMPKFSQARLGTG
jgi:hypothetical protein